MPEATKRSGSGRCIVVERIEPGVGGGGLVKDPCVEANDGGRSGRIGESDAGREVALGGIKALGLGKRLAGGRGRSAVLVVAEAVADEQLLGQLPGVLPKEVEEDGLIASAGMADAGTELRDSALACRYVGE